MSFYNPYMQGPDYAGGVEDFLQQLFQMMMYKKYMDQMGQYDQQGQGQENTEGSANPGGFFQVGQDLAKNAQAGQDWKSQYGPAPVPWQIKQQEQLPQPSLNPWQIRQLMQYMPK